MPAPTAAAVASFQMKVRGEYHRARVGIDVVIGRVFLMVTGVYRSKKIPAHVSGDFFIDT